MKELLRFLTCGSVDDGKSTLIGHMLYDAKLIFVDQKRALELDSKVGSADGSIDYSLLLDGLQAEREQGITIDVAYRFFSTENRSFIVADTPGHEEYTKNMAVGASFAELAVIIVDASHGVLIQTKRHTRICSLMGIRNFIFAINKMDLVGYDEKVFNNIKVQIEGILKDLPISSISIIPVSATIGDNLTKPSINTPWYDGAPLLQLLETVDIEYSSNNDDFCLSVQRVSRPNANFRGFQGEISTGKINIGDKITVLPSNESAHVNRIILAGKDAYEAKAGQPVSLCLDKEIDISRGCVITTSKDLHVGTMMAVNLLWLGNEELRAGQHYRLRLGTQTTTVTIEKICHKIDINTGEKHNVSKLEKNELALCHLLVGIPLVYDSFSKNKELGEFILIDNLTHATAACGVVEYPLGEQGNVLAQNLSITRQLRERANGHRALTLWLSGLSGAGKSTLADAVEKQLFCSGIKTMILDGDNVRMGLCKGLGFSSEGRKENIRRVAEVAKLMNDAGILVIAAFISPMKADREMARQIIGDSYIEVYVNASLDDCINRDVKGMYQKAIRGEIREFTGISSPYEPPMNAEIIVNTSKNTVQECRDIILTEIRKRL